MKCLAEAGRPTTSVFARQIKRISELRIDVLKRLFTPGGI